MSILIDVQMDGWLSEEQIKAFLAPLLPGTSIYCGQPKSPNLDVLMLATVGLRPGILKLLPNLKLIQKLGAGVDSIVSDPDLDQSVRVCRLKPDIPAHEIAEYCLAYVLGEQRHHQHYNEQQKNRSWTPIAPIKSSESTVAILGLGHIGSRAAHYFSTLGFKVIGWSRSEKHLQGVDCRAGVSALPSVLSESDYVVSILPSTKETRELIAEETLSLMRPNAVLINAGRGDLINEAQLLDALNKGSIRGAYLDVFQQEPLPEEHPFWHHPNITVTPHVSGWHLDGGLEVVAENYLALKAGTGLTHEVDINLGY